MAIYFKENLTRIRRNKNITQERLGELCGVSRQAVTKWESGESLPDLFKLDKICDVLGLTIQELVYNKEIIRDDDELRREVKAIHKMMKNRNDMSSSCLFEEYLQLREQNDASEQGLKFMFEGIKALEMAETDHAYELYEKALVRGVTSAGIELLRLFVEWYDSQDTLEEKQELEVFVGRLIQEYGKILVKENEIKYRVLGSQYIL